MQDAITTYKSILEKTPSSAGGYYSICKKLMDDELREKIHLKYSPCSTIMFLDRYCEVHKKKI